MMMMSPCHDDYHQLTRLAMKIDGLMMMDDDGALRSMMTRMKRCGNDDVEAYEGC